MQSVASILESYRYDTEVILGVNCLDKIISEWCIRMGPRGVLVLGRGHSVSLLEQDRLIGNLRSRGLSVQTIKSARSNSSIEHLRRISTDIDPAELNWIAAIGGGGVIDTGKILTLTAQNGFAVDLTNSFEELQRRLDEFNALPLLAAPTCVGSGAEVSSLADILLDSRDVRVPLMSPVMYPKLAVVDCAVASPPQAIQASAIVDAASHLLDPWLNSLPDPPQEEITVALLRTLVRLTRNWIGDGFNQHSLIEFATISHLAVRPGLARSSAAVSVIHRIEHVLSPRIGCSHGEGLAFLLPAFIRWMETNRPDMLVPIADQFAYIFDRAALPSTLVSDWLDTLPVRQWSLNLTDPDLVDLADLTLKSFGDSRGLLPGSLLVGKADVQAILHEATEPRLAKASTARAERIHHHVTNTNRLFGGPIGIDAFHIVMTPIRRIFERLCNSLDATIRNGWFPTALVNTSQTIPTIIVCPPPGNSMAEDCLNFLLAIGHAQSLLFLGLAGSLTHELDCGDIISPTYVWASLHNDRVQRTSAIPLGLMNGKPFQDRAWTVRSVRGLTDESEGLLKAWRWAGVDLVDMESSVVASFCATKEIPFSALLVVSDQPLDGVPLWAQPPFTSDAIVSRSIELAVSQACEVIAGSAQAKLEKEQTYGFKIRP